ncbi:uncharacterized protein LOC111247429 [Varroa destructor]|uniref:Uncharacterized protein n=1 Tax=Varroa destructor TaxID=109461 RepID=A0A7M7JQH8_VARDE|nr:uncharacterized protein LOC111247429 [Varroa destructor]
MLPLAIVKNDAILRSASRRVTNQGNNCDLRTIPPLVPRDHRDTLKSFEDLNIYSLKITSLFEDMSYCIKVGVTLMFSTILSAVISMYRDLTTVLNTQPKTISNERWCILKPADVMILRAQTNRPIPLLCEAPQSQGNNTSTRNPDTVTFFEFIYRQLMCLRKRSSRHTHGACTWLRDLPVSLQIRYVFLIPLCLIALSASMCVVCSQMTTLKEANHRLSGAIGSF